MEIKTCVQPRGACKGQVFCTTLISNSKISRLTETRCRAKGLTYWLSSLVEKQIFCNSSVIVIHMATKLDLNFPELFASVVFRTSFNSFENISATQAWSLFFSGGKENKTFGFNPQVGLFQTTILLSIAASGVAGTLVFQSLFSWVRQATLGFFPNLQLWTGCSICPQFYTAIASPCQLNSNSVLMGIAPWYRLMPLQPVMALKLTLNSLNFQYWIAKPNAPETWQQGELVATSCGTTPGTSKSVCSSRPVW